MAMPVHKSNKKTKCQLKIDADNTKLYEFKKIPEPLGRKSFPTIASSSDDLPEPYQIIRGVRLEFLRLTDGTGRGYFC